MRLLIFFVLFAAGLKAYADPVVIFNSQSPDGKYYLTIEPNSDEGVAAGTAQIRLQHSDRIVGTFEWGGFGVRAGANSFVVFWSQDSRTFAISYELSRGYMFSNVYTLHNSRWTEVKYPDFLKTIFKKLDIAEGGGKGYQTPLKWNNDILKLHVGGRAYIGSGEQRRMVYFDSIVRLHLKDYDSGAIFSEATVEDCQLIGG